MTVTVTVKTIVMGTLCSESSAGTGDVQALGHIVLNVVLPRIRHCYVVGYQYYDVT